MGSTIVLTAVGLCVFLAYSTTSQVARLFGAGRKREGLQAGMNSLWLSLSIGLVLAVLLFVFAELLCSFLGGKGETLQQATIYTQMVLLGVPGMLLVYASNGIFRGLQKVNITLVAAVSGAALNTVLDILFVIVWGWGIADLVLLRQLPSGLWASFCLFLRCVGLCKEELLLNRLRAGLFLREVMVFLYL